MQTGWIKSWRKKIQSPVWQMPPVYERVWEYLLHTVDHKTGETKTSMNNIATGVSWIERGIERKPNRKTISTVLEWMKAENMISYESNRQFTKITVINWLSYNHPDSMKVTAKAQANGLPSGLPSGHITRSTTEVQEEVHVTNNVVEPAKETTELPASGILSDKLSPFDVQPGTPSQEAYALARRFEAILSIHLGTQGHHVSALDAIRRQGKLTDDQIGTAVLEGSKWITENTSSNPWNGILGILRKYDPSAKKNNRAKFECPEHGVMARESWGDRILGAELVYKCRHNGCDHPPYKTGQKHIDALYPWEPKK